MSEEMKVPKHWEIVKLKDITDSIQYGYTESSSKEKIGPKFLRITDIQDNNVWWDDVPFCKIDNELKGKYLLKDGDLVFARTGATVGKSFLIKGDIPEAVFASYLIRVRVNRDINEKYLSCFFHSLSYWSQITEGQVGIGQPNVNGTKLGQLNIPLPPLPEQQAIVSRIEELLSDLENGKQQLQTAQQQLKIYRQSLLKWAFEKPKSFITTKLEDVCEFITKGTTPSKENLISGEGEVPFLKVYNLTFDGTLDFLKDPTYVTMDTHNGFLKRSKVFPGDVLMNIVGPPLGKVTIIPYTFPEWNINQAIVRFRCKESLFNKFLLYFLLSENTIRTYSRKAKATAGQFNLTLEICRDIEIRLPSVTEQQHIVSELESKLTICDKIEDTITKSLQQTETLRQSILKKAFEGKLVTTESTNRKKLVPA